MERRPLPQPVKMAFRLEEDDRRQRILSGVLLIVGPVAFFVGMLVAILSYGPPAYHFVSNSISDLQAVHCGPFDGKQVCSPGNVAANAGVFLAGLCLTFGTLLGGPIFTHGRQRPGAAPLLTLAGLAAAANAFTPEDVTLIGDAVTAFIIFLAADIGLILLGRPSTTTPGLRSRFAYPAVLGEFGFLVLILWSLGLTGPLGSGIEWLVVAPILVWMLAAGTLLLTGPAGTRTEPNRPAITDRAGT